MKSIKWNTITTQKLHTHNRLHIHTHAHNHAHTNTLTHTHTHTERNDNTNEEENEEKLTKFVHCASQIYKKCKFGSQKLKKRAKGVTNL